MKTKIFTLVLAVLYLSCEKNPQVDDNIYYHDLNPDVLLTSTQYYVSDPLTSCQETPVPTDSVAQYFLDINNDNINDFVFTVRRWTYVGSGSSFFRTCLRYKNFSTSINPLNEFNMICSKPSGSREFMKGEVISNDLNWTNFGVTLFGNTIQYFHYYAPENVEHYLGVKIFIDGNPYIGWILVNVTQDQLIIKEYGINLSQNLRIKAGQKK